MTLKTRDANDGMKWKEYSFCDFELFYIFIQKIVPECDRLKCFRQFNWSSDVIKDKFKNFYENNSEVSLTDIREHLHCKSDKCIQKQFWIDRGWTEEEAIQKIKQIQSENSKKVDVKNRVTSTQLKWWTNKGYSEEEAKQLISERQKTFTKEKCIEKYGKEKGEIVYRNRQQKWREALDKKYSKETQNK